MSDSADVVRKERSTDTKHHRDCVDRLSRYSAGPQTKEQIAGTHDADLLNACKSQTERSGESGATTSVHSFIKMFLADKLIEKEETMLKSKSSEEKKKHKRKKSSSSSSSKRKKLKHELHDRHIDKSSTSGNVSTSSDLKSDARWVERTLIGDTKTSDSVSKSVKKKKKHNKDKDAKEKVPHRKSFDNSHARSKETKSSAEVSRNLVHVNAKDQLMRPTTDLTVLESRLKESLIKKSLNRSKDSEYQQAERSVNDKTQKVALNTSDGRTFNVEKKKDSGSNLTLSTKSSIQTLDIDVKKIAITFSVNESIDVNAIHARKVHQVLHNEKIEHRKSVLCSSDNEWRESGRTISVNEKVARSSSRDERRPKSKLTSDKDYSITVKDMKRVVKCEPESPSSDYSNDEEDVRQHSHTHLNTDREKKKLYTGKLYSDKPRIFSPEGQRGRVQEKHSDSGQLQSHSAEKHSSKMYSDKIIEKRVKGEPDRNSFLEQDARQCSVNETRKLSDKQQLRHASKEGHKQSEKDEYERQIIQVNLAYPPQHKSPDRNRGKEGSSKQRDKECDKHAELDTHHHQESYRRNNKEMDKYRLKELMTHRDNTSSKQVETGSKQLEKASSVQESKECSNTKVKESDQQKVMVESASSGKQILDKDTKKQNRKEKTVEVERSSIKQLSTRPSVKSSKKHKELVSVWDELTACDTSLERFLNARVQSRMNKSSLGYENAGKYEDSSRHSSQLSLTKVGKVRASRNNAQVETGKKPDQYSSDKMSKQKPKEESLDVCLKRKAMVSAPRSDKHLENVTGKSDNVEEFGNKKSGKKAEDLTCDSELKETRNRGKEYPRIDTGEVQVDRKGKQTFVESDRKQRSNDNIDELQQNKFDKDVHHDQKRDKIASERDAKHKEMLHAHYEIQKRKININISSKDKPRKFSGKPALHKCSDRDVESEHYGDVGNESKQDKSVHKLDDIEAVYGKDDVRSAELGLQQKLRDENECGKQIETDMIQEQDLSIDLQLSKVADEQQDKEASCQSSENLQSCGLEQLSNIADSSDSRLDKDGNNINVGSIDEPPMVDECSTDRAMMETNWAAIGDSQSGDNISDPSSRLCYSKSLDKQVCSDLCHDANDFDEQLMKDTNVSNKSQRSVVSKNKPIKSRKYRRNDSANDHEKMSGETDCNQKESFTSDKYYTEKRRSVSASGGNDARRSSSDEIWKEAGMHRDTKSKEQRYDEPYDDRARSSSLERAHSVRRNTRSDSRRKYGGDQDRRDSRSSDVRCSDDMEEYSRRRSVEVDCQQRRSFERNYTRQRRTSRDNITDCRGEEEPKGRDERHSYDRVSSENIEKPVVREDYYRQRGDERTFPSKSTRRDSYPPKRKANDYLDQSDVRIASERSKNVSPSRLKENADVDGPSRRKSCQRSCERDSKSDYDSDRSHSGSVRSQKDYRYLERRSNSTDYMQHENTSSGYFRYPRWRGRGFHPGYKKSYVSNDVDLKGQIPDTSYPPRDVSYPPRDAPYPLRDTSYPPRDATYPPRDAAYPPRDATYPPRDASYPPRDASYPPCDAAYPARGGYRGFSKYFQQYDGAARRGWRGGFRGFRGMRGYDQGFINKYGGRFMPVRNRPHNYEDEDSESSRSSSSDRDHSEERTGASYTNSSADDEQDDSSDRFSHSETEDSSSDVNSTPTIKSASKRSRTSKLLATDDTDETEDALEMKNDRRKRKQVLKGTIPSKKLPKSKLSKAGKKNIVACDEIVKPAAEESSSEGDEFRPRKVEEENDDITDLLAKRKDSSSNNLAVESTLTASTNVEEVVSRMTKSGAVPQRIIQSYKDGVAMSRLLKRVKSKVLAQNVPRLNKTFVSGGISIPTRPQMYDVTEQPVDPGRVVSAVPAASDSAVIEKVLQPTDQILDASLITESALVLQCSTDNQVVTSCDQFVDCTIAPSCTDPAAIVSRPAGIDSDPAETGSSMPKISSGIHYQSKQSIYPDNILNTSDTLEPAKFDCNENSDNDEDKDRGCNAVATNPFYSSFYSSNDSSYEISNRESGLLYSDGEDANENEFSQSNNNDIIAFDDQNPDTVVSDQPSANADVVKSVSEADNNASVADANLQYEVGEVGSGVAAADTGRDFGSVGLMQPPAFIPPKRPAQKLGLRISDMSAAFISSGTNFEVFERTRNREEGEVTDSDDSGGEAVGGAGGVESPDSDPAPDDKDKVVDVNLLDTSGSLTDSDEEKNAERKKKHKLSKKGKKSRDRKQKKGAQLKHRRRAVRSPSVAESIDERSRSRSRSFSVSRSFDEKKGVWRENKVRRRPRPSLLKPGDKYTLRDIALKKAFLNAEGRAASKIAQLRELERSTMGVAGSGSSKKKAVVELTDFCKKISDMAQFEDSDSDYENKVVPRRPPSDEEVEEPLANPLLRPKDANIVMNIRNLKQLPVMSAQDKIVRTAALRLQFPVSSGTQHHIKESEWVAVEKPATPATPVEPIVPAVKVRSKSPKLRCPIITAAATAQAIAANSVPASTESEMESQPSGVGGMSIDIGQIVSARLSAMRRLEQDPSDTEAAEAMQRAQMQMQQWAEMKQVPGDFFYSVARSGLLANKLKRHDWLRKAESDDSENAAVMAAVTLQTDLQMSSQADSGANDGTSTAQQESVRPALLTTPGAVTNGANQSYSSVPPLGQPLKPKYDIGKMLLQRMGWHEGLGLGKDNSGPLAPIQPVMKRDRKGLRTLADTPRPPPRPPMVRPINLDQLVPGQPPRPRFGPPMHSMFGGDPRLQGFGPRPLPPFGRPLRPPPNQAPDQFYGQPNPSHGQEQFGEGPPRLVLGTPPRQHFEPMRLEPPGSILGEAPFRMPEHNVMPGHVGPARQMLRGQPPHALMAQRFQLRGDAQRMLRQEMLRAPLGPQSVQLRGMQLCGPMNQLRTAPMSEPFSQINRQPFDQIRPLHMIREQRPRQLLALPCSPVPPRQLLSLNMSRPRQQLPPPQFDDHHFPDLHREPFEHDSFNCEPFDRMPIDQLRQGPPVDHMQQNESFDTPPQDAPNRSIVFNPELLKLFKDGQVFDRSPGDIDERDRLRLQRPPLREFQHPMHESLPLDQLRNEPEPFDQRRLGPLLSLSHNQLLNHINILLRDRPGRDSFDKSHLQLLEQLYNLLVDQYRHEPLNEQNRQLLDHLHDVLHGEPRREFPEPLHHPLNEMEPWHVVMQDERQREPIDRFSFDPRCDQQIVQPPLHNAHDSLDRERIDQMHRDMIGRDVGACSRRYHGEDHGTFGGPPRNPQEGQYEEQFALQQSAERRLEPSLSHYEPGIGRLDQPFVPPPHERGDALFDNSFSQPLDQEGHERHRHRSDRHRTSSRDRHKSRARRGRHRERHRERLGNPASDAGNERMQPGLDQLLESHHERPREPMDRLQQEPVDERYRESLNLVHPDQLHDQHRLPLDRLHPEQLCQYRLGSQEFGNRYQQPFDLSGQELGSEPYRKPLNSGRGTRVHHEPSTQQWFDPRHQEPLERSWAQSVDPVYQEQDQVNFASLNTADDQISSDESGEIGDNDELADLPEDIRKGCRVNDPSCVLIAVCLRQHWPEPNYVLVKESGPPHRRFYHFKVIVNGMEYRSPQGCGSLEVARLDAAAACLRALDDRGVAL